MQAGKQNLSANPSKNSGLRPIDEDLFDDDESPKQEGGIIAAFKRGWRKAFGRDQQSEQADDWSDDDKW